MKNKRKDKSLCCGAPVTVDWGTPNFIGDKNPIIGTANFICTECNEPCDILPKPRRTWKINPATRIKPNKKKGRMFTAAEIREFLRNEDF